MLNPSREGSIRSRAQFSSLSWLLILQFGVLTPERLGKQNPLSLSHDFILSFCPDTFSGSCYLDTVTLWK